MRYWWVNQNQTFRHEQAGGYLWSPKRKSNGDRNPFYEFMREVAPGDLVFSFRDTAIPAVSVATSYATEALRPVEFGAAGQNWAQVGWRVSLSYTMMAHPLRPRDHMAELGPLLPDLYSPLRPSGDGLQAVYLTELGEQLAAELVRLLRSSGNVVPSPSVVGAALTGGDELVAAIEDAAERSLVAESLAPTETEALVRARRGQGIFRDRVLRIERRCRITGVADTAFLVAGHTKPWRSSTNVERLDGENGLMFTPTFDRLFDRGFIGFSDSGALIVAPVLEADTARRLGLPAPGFSVGSFSLRQREFLKYHRDYVLKKAETRP